MISIRADQLNQLLVGKFIYITSYIESYKYKYGVYGEFLGAKPHENGTIEIRVGGMNEMGSSVFVDSDARLFIVLGGEEK